MKKTTEDYLKMIYILKTENGTVRSIAIAKALGVSRPTVSNIVKRLIAEGNIVMLGDHTLELTDKGQSTAEETMERNRTIRDLLVSLGVNKSIAEKDACEMEHSISDQSISVLKDLAHRL